LGSVGGFGPEEPVAERQARVFVTEVIAAFLVRIGIAAWGVAATAARSFGILIAVWTSIERVLNVVRTSPLVVVNINDVLLAATNAPNKSSALMIMDPVILLVVRGPGTVLAERQLDVFKAEVQASLLERIDVAGCAAALTVGKLIAV
jgi:hypothetical protein